MNERFDQLISKEVQRILEKGEADTHGMFGDTKWSITSYLTIFLSNSI